MSFGSCPKTGELPAMMMAKANNPTLRILAHFNIEEPHPCYGAISKPFSTATALCVGGCSSQPEILGVSPNSQSHRTA